MFKKERNWIILLIILLIFLSIAYSILSVVRHNHFESGGFDLGIFDQGIWLYSRFEAPVSTIKERILLGDHFNLTIILAAPLFYIWDNVRILLIFQATFISFSAFAIYFLARLRKLSPFSSIILAVMYSLFFGIQYAVYFDWHPIVYAAAILAWLIYFYESKKKWLFVLSLILLFLTQENAGIGLACVGFIYIFKKETRRDALLFIIGGVLISFVELRIVALFSPQGYEYSPQFAHSPIELLKKYFNSPDKILVWKYSLASYSYIPLLSPGAILAMFLDLSQYFLPNKEYPHMITPYFHHRVILAPILALATIDVVLYLKKMNVRPEYLLSVTFIVVCMFQFKYHHALNKLSKPIYFVNYSWIDDNNVIIKQVPPNVSIAAQQSMVPHLTHRKEIYLLWPRKSSDSIKCLDKKDCWWLDFSGKPKFLVVDIHPGATITQLLESRENFASALNNMEKAGKISVWRQQGDARIYKIIY